MLFGNQFMNFILFFVKKNGGAKRNREKKKNCKDFSLLQPIISNCTFKNFQNNHFYHL